MIDFSYFHRLQIDATGSVVNKFKQASGKNTNTIFLYDCTIHDTEIKKQYSVCNMLSEAHDGL